nr:IS3 family transposase [Salipiger thiooxidans]
MIEPDHPDLSIGQQCKLLSIARSSFYYTPKGETEQNLGPRRRIDEQFLETPFFGVRQMTWHLRNDGHLVNEKRIRRLMSLMGLMPIYQKPNTSRPTKGHKTYPYLLRGLRVERPNQVWCSDITYLPMRRGFLYLVAIMDWHNLRETPAHQAVLIGKVERDRWQGATVISEAQWLDLTGGKRRKTAQGPVDRGRAVAVAQSQQDADPKTGRFRALCARLLHQEVGQPGRQADRQDSQRTGFRREAIQLLDPAQHRVCGRDVDQARATLQNGPCQISGPRVEAEDHHRGRRQGLRPGFGALEIQYRSLAAQARRHRPCLCTVAPGQRYRSAGSHQPARDLLPHMAVATDNEYSSHVMFLMRSDLLECPRTSRTC